jgi:DNA invertase Pin-like site-specific DNA recombinase
MERGVKFTAVNPPDANKFMLHIYASLAQQERKEVGARTRAALAAARARGTLMGTRRSNCAGGRALADRMRQQADERAESLRSRIEALAAEGVTSVRGVAAALGINKTVAHRLLKRLRAPVTA